MYIGSRVNDRHGNDGTIIETFKDFWHAAKNFKSITGQQWLDAQIVPFSEDQLNEQWANVDCDTNGVTLNPFSSLTEECDDSGDS